MQRNSLRSVRRHMKRVVTLGAAVLFIAGLPTSIIDTYNAQDLSNRETVSLIPSFATRRTAAGSPMALLDDPDHAHRVEAVRYLDRAVSRDDPAETPGANQRLKVSGRQLLVNGSARFLLGVSLFDALGTTPPRDEDLNALERWGISIVRVWAHWNDPIYAADGSLTAQGRSRLERLIHRFEQRGLLLELVLLRPGQLPGQRFALFSSVAARERAVREVSTALKPYRDVLFDLYNEHDHPDGPVTHAEARRLRDAVKAIDSSRPVTVSSTEYHFVDARGMLDERGLANLRDEVGLDAQSTGVDLLAPHLPGPASAMDAEVRLLSDALERVGRPIPIYVNEGARAGPGRPLVLADTYIEVLRDVRDAGAAGAVFHTAAGYDLKKISFGAALNNEERRALSELRSRLGPSR